MPDSNIIQIDQNLFETKLDRLVTEKMTQILNAMLDAEADEIWIGNGVLDRFLEDESLFGEFLRTPVSEGGVEPLVVEPPHVVVEVGA